MKKSLLVLTSLPLAVMAGDFRFANVISDHAVLQRDIAAPVWGWADPGEPVTVSLNGTEVAQTVADKDGRWLVKLPPQKANKNPSVISARGKKASQEIRDVLFGDVWFGCGQSNMAFKFNDFGWKIPDSKEFVAKANKDTIRILLMDVPNTGFTQTEAPCVRWKKSDPRDTTSVANFGAALYYMGDKLESELDIPIGLVDSSWGMTRLSGWLDPVYAREQGEGSAKTIGDNYEKARKDWFENGGAEAFAEKMYAWNAKFDPIGNYFPWSPKWKPGDKSVFDPGFTCENCVTVKLPIANFRTPPFPSDFSNEHWLRGEFELSMSDLLKGDVYLQLDCFGRSAAWVNGVKIGETYQDSPDYLIPKTALRVDGKNVVAILFKAWNPSYKLGGVYTPIQIRAVSPDYTSTVLTTIPELTASWAKSAPKDDQPPHDPRKAIVFTPTSMFNGLVAPLFPMAIKGAVWYQGCSDLGNGGYADQFRALVGGWRKGFTYKDKLPVIITEIAPHDIGNTKSRIEKGETKAPTGSMSAQVRCTQGELGESVPDCGTVSLLDLGEPDIHPCRKRPCGERWARWALAKVYGRDLLASGPVVTQVEWQGKTAVVHFKNAKGLKTSDGKAPTGFEIGTGAKDSKLVYANAKIVGETILLSHPEVDDIGEIKYAWFDLPVGWNVVNADDLPLGVFHRVK